jgi:hypothetical protein
LQEERGGVYKGWSGRSNREDVVVKINMLSDSLPNEERSNLATWNI